MTTDKRKFNLPDISPDGNIFQFEEENRNKKVR